MDRVLDLSNKRNHFVDEIKSDAAYLEFNRADEHLYILKTA